MENPDKRYKIRKIKGRIRRTNLRIILREKGITISELAKITDLEISQVSNICSGKQKDMKLSTAKKICNALNISLEEAFGD
jgi:transcriptional regulator with XRE-family HTH domain